MNIKLKMVVWYGILTSILLIFFLLVLYSLLSNAIFENLEDDVYQTTKEVLNQLNLETTDDGESILPEGFTFPSDQPIAVISNQGDLLYDNSGFSWINELPYHNNAFWNQADNGENWLVYDKQIVKDDQLLGMVRIAVLQTSVDERLSAIRLQLGVGGMIFLIFAVCGGFFIAGRSLKPLEEMTKTAQEIAQGDLTSRIPEVKTKDEVGTLVVTFNAMLENLETAFNREKQFTSDASHELRTPIAIIMNTCEELIYRMPQDPDETLEAYQTILGESIHMNRIVAQLLALNQGQAGKYPFNPEIISLCDTIQIVIEQLEEMALEKHVKLVLNESPEIMIEADQTLMTQLFLNVIENAIKYSGADGFLKIWIEQIEDEIKIRIMDNGIGISQVDLPHIFERFYRADKIRDRSGSGLGLSIVKWIVEVHQGSIEVKSDLNQGTELLITFRAMLR